MASFYSPTFPWLVSYNRIYLGKFFCSMVLIASIVYIIIFIKTPVLEKAEKFFAGLEKEVESTSKVYILDTITFKKGYKEMEEKFKIFMYPDGHEDMYYHSPRYLSGLYASEGYFFKNIKESSFLTDDPHLAQLFFIPISCRKLRGKVKSDEEITEIVQKPVLSLTIKYKYWNRTKGADHFIVSCNDICNEATKRTRFMFENVIRVMCSSTYDNGFIEGKDVSLPQVLLPFDCPPGGYPDTNRTILGYWAGNINSVIRKRLVELWQDDNELDILKKGLDKERGLLKCRLKFKRSKFCICPGGSSVNSICIARAIYYGCVPVILSNNSVLPFKEILDWTKFSVILQEDEVHQLKNILKDRAKINYTELQSNLAQVQRHFIWNTPAVRYDAFHMVLHDLWLRTTDNRIRGFPEYNQIHSPSPLKT